jgi:hypothetical protein
MIKQQHKGNIPFSIQYSNYIQMKFHYITNSNSKHAFAQQYYQMELAKWRSYNSKSRGDDLPDVIYPINVECINLVRSTSIYR